MTTSNKLDSFYALHPAQFPLLKSIALSRNTSPDADTRFSVAMTFVGNQHPSSVELHLFFDGVVDFRLGDLGLLAGLVMEIEDMRGQQLEGLAYRVTERECDAFSFSCTSFAYDLQTTVTDDDVSQ